ncbi:MAG: VWA domain-containing protein [Ruaniaceae bacterium]|nr:VWA domain-containing protein [Ruaniaceae bacterium]
MSQLMPWIVGGLVAAGLLLGWLLGRRRDKRAQTFVSNTDYIYTLPSFQRRLALQRMAAGSTVALIAMLTIPAAGLAGRPVDRFTQDERMATRDIVLCLDVSGSMMGFDSEVLRKFAEMIPSFAGERIALNVWNATTRVVFPLTDDYAMIEQELNLAAELLDMNFFNSQSSYQDLEDWLAGTWSPTSMNSSLIGDGLANCALSFDLSDTERSRTIIMATDNQVAGDEVFTLSEAAEFAADRDITVHAIYAAEFGFASERDEYERIILEHGGLFYELSDPNATASIIDEITRQQAIELNADPKVIELDRPDRYFGWLAALVGLLIVGAWGVRS